MRSKFTEFDNIGLGLLQRAVANGKTERKRACSRAAIILFLGI